MGKVQSSTIIEQLGGNKFLTMTGCKCLLALENGIRMDLVKNRSGANKLEITLDGTDLYNMRFYKHTVGRLNKKSFVYTDDKLTEVAEHNGVYAEQLQELFVVTTGMDTHL